MSKPYIVGITGGSASGKTQFLKALRNEFSPSELCVISQDDYYLPIEHQQKDENGEVNFDLPESIDKEKLLNHLKWLGEGKPIEKFSYNFNNPNKEKEKIILHPAPIILIEGLFIFYFQEVFDLLDLKIFVEAGEDIKLQRRINRDTNERGIAYEMVLYQWHNHVQPAFQKFLLPYKESADLIILNNKHFDNSLQVVKNHFKLIVKEWTIGSRL